MRFTPTRVAGVVVVDLDPHVDERGEFARAFCRAEFAAAGLVPPLEQVNLVTTHRAGTVRGVHWQVAEAAEAKLVRVVRGAIHDVAVDVREGSPTHRQWVGVDLDAASARALYLPPGVAHGYQTLVDDTVVLYQTSAPHTPDAERGLRFDDPAVGITWPLPVTVVSAKDRAWPLL